jgi:hypothetical protein
MEEVERVHGRRPLGGYADRIRLASHLLGLSAVATALIIVSEDVELGPVVPQVLSDDELLANDWHHGCSFVP